MSVRFVHLGSFPLADGFAASVQKAAARGVVHRNRTLIAQHVDHGEELRLHTHPGPRVCVTGNRVPRRHHVHIGQSAAAPYSLMMARFLWYPFAPPWS
jgi:hypothetical protein